MLAAAAGVWLIWRALPEVPVREVVFVNASLVANLEPTAPNAPTKPTGSMVTAPIAPFVHLKTEELNRVAAAVGIAKLNALRADLNEIKVAVEQLEWVRRADVRRRLPDKIEVRIEEHVPFGIWHELDSVQPTAASLVSLANAAAEPKSLASESNTEDKGAVNGMLINSFGEVFKASLPNTEFAALPILGGPPAASKDVIVTFDQFRKQLVSIERTPRELQLSVRRAWTVKLDNGVALELGRNEASQRLQRFIQAQSQIVELKAANIHVDLRYASGLALRNLSRVANFKTIGAPEKLVSSKSSSAKNKVSAKPAAKKNAKKVKTV